MIVVIPSYLSQFNYQLSGPTEGRKWVFLHGLLGSFANWRKIISTLAETDRVLAFDQRGHGRSFHPLSGYAPADYAEDLFLIAQELGFEKFILVGHSMGGRNALSFAHQFPEKLEKLVIEDIGPESDPQSVEYYESLLNGIPTPFSSRREAKEYFLNEFPAHLKKLTLPGRQPESAETIGAYLNSNLAEVQTAQGEKWDWRFSKEGIFQSVRLGRAKDQWQELRQLTMPTLLIRGENSQELSHAVFQLMLHANANIRGLEIRNAGHWVHADQAQEFLQALREFAF